MELVFHALLSENIITLDGILIVAGVGVLLSRENLRCKGFFSKSYDHDMKLELICQIIFLYGQTRGTYFIWKMNA